MTAALPLRVERLRKEFPAPLAPLVVLAEISFELGVGETLALVGPSGSGKSTLLYLIGALDRPTDGTIHLGDTEVGSLTGEALAAHRCRSVGMVFQEHHLLPQCSALENVQLPALAARETQGSVDRARDLLTQVGLAERLHHLPAELSGGERQRVAVARALMNRPPLLLCDEPTGNLDQASGQRVVDLILELAQAQEAGVILVTHDATVAHRCQTQRELVGGVLRDRDG